MAMAVPEDSPGFDWPGCQAFRHKPLPPDDCQTHGQYDPMYALPEPVFLLE